MTTPAAKRPIGRPRVYPVSFQFGMKTSPEKIAQIKRLVVKTGKSAREVMEQAIDHYETQLNRRNGPLA